MKRISVVTTNLYLGQKIRLTLSGKASVSVVESFAEPCDLCLWDIDTSGNAPSDDKVITMSYENPAALTLPCSFDALFDLVSKSDSCALALRGKICYLRGEAIKLTELEAALLALLISADGDFVSREEILKRVWQNDADPGIINVYIHYLREKIDRGEKIILSSRKRGYGIDEKYLRGDAKNA